MVNISEAREIVCDIIYNFIEKLYMRGANRERNLQFAMSILCKAKGDCSVLTFIEEELSAYLIKKFDIDSVVAEIQTVCADKRDEVLPVCADIIMDKFTNGAWGEYLQPRELTKLALALVNDKGCKTVYNPFAGLGSYAIAPFIEKYYGQEINFTTCNIAKMRLELNNIDYSNYELGDSIKDWNDHDADCIVSTPPFGIKLHSHPDISLDIVSCEDYLLRRFMSSNSEYAFFVISKSFCNSSLSPLFHVRKEICDNNLLDMVIDLPSGIFSSTSIATSIVVLSKTRSVDCPVVFVDAEAQFISKKGRKVLDINTIHKICQNKDDVNHVSLNLGKLKENSYIWNAGFYKADRDVVIPKGYDQEELGNIITSIRGIRDFHETKGRLVNVSDLSHDVLNCVPNIGIVSFDKKMFYKIVEPVLLISPIRDLRPSYFIASPEDPLFVNVNIWPFKITAEWVNPQYLCLQLSKAYRVLSGITIPRITRELLYKTKLAFPSKGKATSYKEQEQLYEEFVQATKLSKAKEIGLQEVIEKMKADYINVIRARKHDMRPYVRELGSIERMMRQYIQNIDFSTIAPKMTSLLDQHKFALDKLKDLIDIFSEEQQFGKPEQFNINQYFVDLEVNHDETSGYWIEYDRDDNAIAEYGIPVPCGGPCDENLVPLDPDSELFKEIMEEENKFPLIVDINHVDFERLVRNIIENAVTHGFTDSNREDYGIGIDLTIDMDKRMFQIDFSNNGTPLPSGMDKLRYGILGEKAGTTARTGRGGYIVKSIVEHYHGDYDVFMDGQNTVIRILLPISSYDYEYEQEI